MIHTIIHAFLSTSRKANEGYYSIRTMQLASRAIIMVSHSVTCHLAEVTFPPSPQPRLVLDLSTSEGCKAELTLLHESGPTGDGTRDLPIASPACYLYTTHACSKLPTRALSAERYCPLGQGGICHISTAWGPEFRQAVTDRATTAYMRHWYRDTPYGTTYMRTYMQNI